MPFPCYCCRTKVASSTMQITTSLHYWAEFCWVCEWDPSRKQLSQQSRPKELQCSSWIQLVWALVSVLVFGDMSSTVPVANQECSTTAHHWTEVSPKTFNRSAVCFRCQIALWSKSSCLSSSSLILLKIEFSLVFPLIVGIKFPLGCSFWLQWITTFMKKFVLLMLKSMSTL